MEYGFRRNGERLRCGYTTGSCAAAAAKAATLMLCGSGEVRQIRLTTPGGQTLLLDVEDIRIETQNGARVRVRCAVQKDAGDDPDVTNGAYICASAEWDAASEAPAIVIEGGEGVGRVTRPGLDQPVGAAAINSVPRRMIAEAVREALREADAAAGIRIEISVPEGRALAERTFNPRLGIEGGISILGTTGIVTPMSDEAVRDTIRAEISVRRAEAYPVLPMTPGNYGQAFFEREYGISLNTAVECANFVYDAVRMACEAGFRKLLFVGHIGKLVKVAGGVRNTHSRYGDRRMEILYEIASEVRRERAAAGPAEARGDAGLKEELLSCVSTDAALGVLRARRLEKEALRKMTLQIRSVMEEWAAGGLAAEVIVFSNVYGRLGETEGAARLVRALRRHCNGNQSGGCTS